MSDNQACKTPLLDLLDSVPADARALYEHHNTSHSHIPYGRLCHEAAARIRELESTQHQIHYYESIMSDVRRLTRDLDVALNGDGAAPQASLCDLVSQVKLQKGKDEN